MTGYELRVAGHLDPHWAGRLGGLDLTHGPDGTTTLAGPDFDQARLHGVLAGIRDLGAELLGVRAVAAAPALPVLRTERLLLRPATPGDADATWEYRRLPEVAEWLTQLPADLEQHRSRFRRGERLASSLVVELGGRVIGDLMLRRQDAWAQAEVLDRARGAEAEAGWTLHPAHRGHGYATEAVRALIGAAFADLGVHRVVAACFAENHASRRVMERLGMRLEAHHVRHALHRSGRRLDSLVYAVLAEDWPS